MTNFTLATDSCADECKSVLASENIDCLPLAYHDGENTYYDNFDSKEEYLNFYNELKIKNFKTTACVPYEAEELFKNLLEKNKQDIVFVSLSSGLSSSYRNAEMAANEINSTSEHKVYVIDSLAATQVQHMILDRAKECRDSGKTAKETFEIVSEFAKKVKCYFYVSDLETLKRGGRVSPLQATFGKVFKINPILSFDEDGGLIVVNKAVGSKAARKYIIDKLESLVNTNYPIYIAHTNNEQEVEDFKAMLNEKFNEIEVKTGFVGPIIASHTGASLLGAIYVSK